MTAQEAAQRVADLNDPSPKTLTDAENVANKASVESQRALKDAGKAVREAQSAAAVVNDDEKIEEHVHNNEKVQTKLTEEDMKGTTAQIAEVKGKEAELIELVRNEMLKQTTLKKDLLHETQHEKQLEKMLAAEINTRKKQSQRQKVKDARLKQLIKGQATPNSDLTTKSDRQATPNSELTAESAQLPTQAKTQPNEEVPTISKVKHSNKEHTSKMKTVPPVPPQATVKKAVAEASPAVNLNSLVVPGMNKQEQQS